MKQITAEELKQINIQILKDVHNFCSQNNIKYSLAYGTLLGAVRHKGFIPWDDDIDILMLRSDYERFLQLYNKNESDMYRVLSSDTDRQFRYAFAKVVDNRTIKDEIGYNKLGVGIDLFPIDKIPNDINIAKKLFKRHEIYWNLYTLKNMKWNKKRFLGKNLIMLLSKSFLCFLPYSFLYRLMKRSAVHYCYLKDNYLLGCLFAPYGIKNMMPREVFENTILMPFERTSFYGLGDFDTYLSNLYGDYMKLPPIEKRGSHHSFNAYWK